MPVQVIPPTQQQQDFGSTLMQQALSFVGLRNAQRQLEQNVAQLDLAKQQLELADRQLELDSRKIALDELNAEPARALTQAQADTARAALVADYPQIQADYMKALTVNTNATAEHQRKLTEILSESTQTKQGLAKQIQPTILDSIRKNAPSMSASAQVGLSHIVAEGESSKFFDNLNEVYVMLSEVQQGLKNTKTTYAAENMDKWIADGNHVPIAVALGTTNDPAYVQAWRNHIVKGFDATTAAAIRAGNQEDLSALLFSQFAGKSGEIVINNVKFVLDPKTVRDDDARRSAADNIARSLIERYNTPDDITNLSGKPITLSSQPIPQQQAPQQLAPQPSNNQFEVSPEITVAVKGLNTDNPVIHIGGKVYTRSDLVEHAKNHLRRTRKSGPLHVVPN